MITLVDYLYGILLPNNTLIAELSDCTPAAALQALSGFAAGDPIPSFQGAHGAAPSIDFRTPQIKDVLDSCGLFGYDTGAGNTDLHYRSGDLLSTRIATGLRLRCVSSMLYWSQITARQNALAEISCKLIPTFDGTNAPMVAAGATAVPTAALAQQYFTLGPVAINGAAVAGVTDWSLDLGVKTHLEAGDGEPYPSWAGIEQHNPVLTVNTRTLAQFASVGVGGLALTALTFYLRKKQIDAGGCVANATSEHIKFTATSGAAFVENASGGADGPAACGLKIHLRRHNASAAHALAISTASAIT